MSDKFVCNKRGLRSKITVPSQRRKEVGTQLQGKLQKQTNASSTTTTGFAKAKLNDAIRRLKTKKAPGKDKVCNETIKHHATAVREKLELFNQPWRPRIFPTALKEATITPVLKKEKDPKKQTCYRPISLLSCCDETLEGIVKKSLMLHHGNQ